MNLFYAVRRGVSSQPTFVPAHEKTTPTGSIDYYNSLYYYTKEQVDEIKFKGTVTGTKETITNRLFFDFDAKDNINLAREEALSLCKNFIDNEGLTENHLNISFSGSKGFHVELLLDKYITPPQLKSAIFSLAGHLTTCDKVVNDPNRIVRMMHSKHLVTNLYKIPISLNELQELSDLRIRELAKYPRQLGGAQSSCSINSSHFEEPIVIAPVKITTAVDVSKRPKGWPACKWALVQGLEVRSGNRQHPLLCVAATAKALNYTQADALHFVTEAHDNGVAMYKCAPREAWEIEKPVLEVFHESWEGGMYSCKTTPWLKSICDSLGEHKCSPSKISNFQEIEKAMADYIVFAKDIDKNTIKTGIEQLDENVRFRTGQMIGLLGAPSSGKTSIALEILEKTSKQGLLSVFYSLDMAGSELFQRIAQKVTGFSEEKILEHVQNAELAQALVLQVTEAYKNVKFCFDTGVSVETIQKSITEWQEAHNKKLTLLMIDYNELLSSEFSDATASTGSNAGLLKAITNTNQICTISLLQPQKAVGDASDEIYSYRNTKGSSLLEQCFSVLIGIFRPGFSPKTPESDKYLIMNVLKNRMGKLSSMEFSWEGLTGKIETLSTEGSMELAEFLKAQEAKDESLNAFQKATRK